MAVVESGVVVRTGAHGSARKRTGAHGTHRLDTHGVEMGKKRCAATGVWMRARGHKRSPVTTKTQTSITELNLKAR